MTSSSNIERNYTVTSNSGDGYSFYRVQAANELAACEQVAAVRGCKLDGDFFRGGIGGRNCIRFASGNTLTLEADLD